MGKSKKATEHSGKPITAFFTRSNTVKSRIETEHRRKPPSGTRRTSEAPKRKANFEIESPDEEDEAPISASPTAPKKRRVSPVEGDATNTNVDIGLPSPAPSENLEPPKTPLTPVLKCPSQQHTPPLTDGSTPADPKDSPIIVTSEEKTAAIIARIKAEAQAAACSSPEEPTTPEFKDELSDSEDDDELFPILSLDKGKGKAKDDGLGSPFKETSPPSESRYNLRNYTPKTETPRTYEPSSVTKRPSKPKKSTNPLDQLLREKEKADKNRKGVDDFERAEQSIVNTSFLLAMDDDEYRATLEGSPNKSRISIGEVNELDRKRLLGAETGAAIENILRNDRECYRDLEKERGVPFFVLDSDDGDVFMDAPYRIPPATFDDVGHPVLRLFKIAITSKSLDQAMLLLNSRVLASVNFGQHPSIISYLYGLALCTDQSKLPITAFNFLSDLCTHSSIPSIPLSLLLNTLLRLGAIPDVLKSFGWEPDLDVASHRVNSTIRQKVLYRSVHLLSKSARTAQIPKEQIPDFVLMLLLIAMDPHSSNDIQHDVMFAIDEIFMSIAEGSSIDKETESAICNRLLKYSSILEPVNQAYLVTFLTGGSKRGARIARWVARSLVIGLTTVTKKQYRELPPLGPILDELLSCSTIPTSPGLFNVKTTTDFVNMGYYTQLLSVAITDIDEYVVEEKARPRPSKPFSEERTLLESIHSVLETLHSSIEDVRAAHLDRSRTKSLLKQTSLRIHYQREAALRARSSKPKTLLKYFSKNIISTPS